MEGKTREKIRICFFTGDGKHFDGRVNYLIATPDYKSGIIYAECKWPDGTDDDYGYIDLMKALGEAYVDAGGDREDLEFPYDNLTSFLLDDAWADCDVYTVVDITTPSDDEYNDEPYTPSSTAGDYGPSNPWDAPGMSIHDFI